MAILVLNCFKSPGVWFLGFGAECHFRRPLNADAQNRRFHGRYGVGWTSPALRSVFKGDGIAPSRWSGAQVSTKPHSIAILAPVPLAVRERHAGSRWLWQSSE